MSRKHRRKRRSRAWWIVPLVIVCVILLAVAAYAAYILLSYQRLEDDLPCEVTPPQDGSDAAEMVQAGQTYTIFTQNIGFGAGSSDFTFFADGGEGVRAASVQTVEDNLRMCAEHLSDYDPDFILLQAVDKNSTRSLGTDQPDLLSKQFGSYASSFAQSWDSPYLCYPVKTPVGFIRTGMMTLTDVTPASVTRRSLPVSETLTRLIDHDRCYTVTRIPVSDGKELVLINVHLSAYADAADLQEPQLKMLFKEMSDEYEKGNYVICGGTFSADFTGDSVKKLNNAAGSNISWAQPLEDDLIPDHMARALDYENGKLLPTCRNRDIPYKTGNFTAITDGFIVSDNVTVTQLKNIQTGFAYSDHNPVLMKFVLGEMPQENGG